MSDKIILSGAFVALRPIVEDDAEITFSWRQSDRASLLNQGALTISQQRSWINSRPKSEMNFIIELKDGLRVGMLSLIDINLVHKRAEPSRFLIGEESAVRGIPVAFEAMLLLYKYAFNALKLRRLYGTIASNNKAMIKWQKYLGMKEEGCLKEHLFLDGVFQDAICLGLTISDYEKVSLPRMKALIKAGKAVKN